MTQRGEETTDDETPKFQKVDVSMGRVLRDHRLVAGVTQKELANASRISFQQIQKYESGANRISISRPFEMSHTLNVKPSDLIIAVETLLAHTENANYETHLNQDDTQISARSHALYCLSCIEDRIALEIIGSLLELLNPNSGLTQRISITSNIQE